MNAQSRRPSSMRRLIAAHEAGHAAVSLALGQGHQEGVSAEGWHRFGNQFDLDRLPSGLAEREAIKLSMVGLAGCIAQAECAGGPFILSNFLSYADELEGDAAMVLGMITFLNRHLGQDVITIEQLAADTAHLLANTTVAGLTAAITTSLIRRGRIGGDGLGRIHDRHPTDPDLQWIPSLILEAAECRAAGRAVGHLDRR